MNDEPKLTPDDVLTRILDAVDGVPEMLESAARLAEDAGWPTNETVAAYYAKAQALRDALAVAASAGEPARRSESGGVR
jgi:hypothetical protein